jgi:hypothetical protein
MPGKGSRSGTDFNFGFNVKPKTPKGTKKPRTAAQRAAAKFYATKGRKR